MPRFHSGDPTLSFRWAARDRRPEKMNRSVAEPGSVLFCLHCCKCSMAAEGKLNECHMPIKRPLTSLIVMGDDDGYQSRRNMLEWK